MGRHAGAEEEEEDERREGWTAEKRDSVEEAKEQAYQPGINKIPRAVEW